MSGNCLALPQFWYYWFPQNKDFLIICAIKQLYNLTITQQGGMICEGTNSFFGPICMFMIYMLSLSDQHISSPINPKYNDWFCHLQRFTQIVLKFKTQVWQVLNFRTICVNLCKSDKISCQICWPDKEYITWKSSKLQQSQSAYIVSSSLKSYCKIRMLLYKSFNPIVLMTESSFCNCLWLRMNIKNYIHCCEKSFIYPLQLVFEEKKNICKSYQPLWFYEPKSRLASQRQLHARVCTMGPK